MKPNRSENVFHRLCSTMATNSITNAFVIWSFRARILPCIRLIVLPPVVIELAFYLFGFDSECCAKVSTEHTGTPIHHVRLPSEKTRKTSLWLSQRKCVSPHTAQYVSRRLRLCHSIKKWMMSWLCQPSVRFFSALISIRADSVRLPVHILCLAAQPLMFATME